MKNIFLFETYSGYNILPIFNLCENLIEFFDTKTPTTHAWRHSEARFNPLWNYDFET